MARQPGLFDLDERHRKLDASKNLAIWRHF